jgi:hypothetical protein
MHKYYFRTLGVCILFHLFVIQVSAQKVLENWQHEISLGTAITFYNKNIPFNTIELKPGNDLIYRPAKGYQVPALRLRYIVQKPIYKNTTVGLEAGSIFRYQEKVTSESYYTFYSFPLCMNATQVIYNENKFSVQTKLHGGYNFKHPKHKLLDGLGGMTGGASLVFFHKKKKVKYELGYEVQQDKLFYNINVAINSNQPPEIVSGDFKVLVQQIFMAVSFPLNKVK